MLINGQHKSIIPRITLVILAFLQVNAESITALYPHEPLAVPKERLMTDEFILQTLLKGLRLLENYGGHFKYEESTSDHVRTVVLKHGRERMVNPLRTG
jgi:hypothetical protein